MLHLALAIAVLASVANASLAPTHFDTEVGALVHKLAQLYSMGVNVEPLIKEVDRAVELYQRGEVSKAVLLLKRVKERLRVLESEAPSVALRKRLVLGAEVCGLASIPLVTYLALPRIYLLLWYRSRRKWLVERVRR